MRLIYIYVPLKQPPSTIGTWKSNGGGPQKRTWKVLKKTMETPSGNLHFQFVGLWHWLTHCDISFNQIKSEEAWYGMDDGSMDDAWLQKLWLWFLWFWICCACRYIMSRLKQWINVGIAALDPLGSKLLRISRMWKGLIHHRAASRNSSASFVNLYIPTGKCRFLSCLLLWSLIKQRKHTLMMEQILYICKYHRRPCCVSIKPLRNFFANRSPGPPFAVC